MSLSTYQHAILQEMGIPVWVPKDALDRESQVNSNTPASSPAVGQGVSPSQSATHSTPITQEQKQSRLEQLRAQMNAGADKEATVTNQKAAVASEQQKQESELESKPSKDIAPSPLGVPLSAAQRNSAQQWLEDLQLACVVLGLPSHLASSVMIGTSLSVDSQALVLPVEPLSLTASQKRALWQALGNAAKAL
ncbi:alanine acetyltransferase [Alteromonas gracilis]|uniref:alanine acetyltransferase n=1 Tax=Alteromonas gracilis TaxID=1479524 RepID=UPI0030D1C896